MPQPVVPQPQMQVVRATEVRRSLTIPGDVRTEVAFQNDINALLARFDEARAPWQPLCSTLPALPIHLGPAAATGVVVRKRAAGRARGADADVGRLREVDAGLPQAPPIAP